MLKKLTRAEAHKAMDDGKVIVTKEKNIRAWRDDANLYGPYVVSTNGDPVYRLNGGWWNDWYLEVEEPWRPVEGEAVYVRDEKDRVWAYSIFSHIDKEDKSVPFITSGGSWWSIIAPVKGNEGSAGTTGELKNTLTAEDLK